MTTLSKNSELREASIDLTKYGARVFTGRQNGIKASREFSVAEKSSSADKLTVIVPGDTKTLNSSFILGLLGEQIVQCGSKDRFLEKFNFRMPERFSKQLEMAISRALFNLNNDPSLI